MTKPKNMAYWKDKNSKTDIKSPFRKFDLASKMPTSDAGIIAGAAGVAGLGYLLGKRKKKQEIDPVY